MKRIPLLFLLFSITLVCAGCLSVESKEYHIKLKTETSGEATIKFVNIVSESDDTTDVSAEDFQQLIETYLSGDQLEKENPGYRNVKKKLYVEKGVLVGEVSFTFDSLNAVRLFKFDKESPLMYYASNPLSSETLLETNGIQGEEWMPVVFWKRDARELFVKTKVSSESGYRTNLLKHFREWQAAQSKKK
ncbi:MAG: hypothetical protein HY961_19815 [Ignavibacteriae bacterium]|nr:hypothetical protein [Ignavibacteriota bacterium]